MTLSKGYFLGKWFRIGDIINAQMREIFVRNNVLHLELSQLPKHEMEKWKALHKKSDRVTSNICKIINNK